MYEQEVATDVLDEATSCIEFAFVVSSQPNFFATSVGEEVLSFTIDYSLNVRHDALDLRFLLAQSRLQSFDGCLGGFALRHHFILDLAHHLGQLLFHNVSTVGRQGHQLLISLVRLQLQILIERLVYLKALVILIVDRTL